LDIVKKFGPPSENSSPPGVPSQLRAWFPPQTLVAQQTKLNQTASPVTSFRNRKTQIFLEEITRLEKNIAQYISFPGIH